MSHVNSLVNRRSNYQFDLRRRQIMQSCKNCAQTLAEGAKFCSNCGTKVPSSAQISVEQDIGTVSGSGTVTGTVLGDTDSLPGSSSSVKQKVDTVTGGGAVIGTVVGGESATHIGWWRQDYGRRYIRLVRYCDWCRRSSASKSELRFIASRRRKRHLRYAPTQP